MSNQSDSNGVFEQFALFLLPLVVVVLVWLGAREHIIRGLMAASPPVFSFTVKHMPRILLPDEMRSEMARLAVNIPKMNYKAVAKKEPLKSTWKLLTLHGYFFRIFLIPLFGYFLWKWYRQVPNRMLYKRELGFIDQAYLSIDYAPWVKPALEARVWERDPFVGTWKMPLNDFDWLMTKGLVIYKKGTKNELTIPPQGTDFVRLTIPKKRAIKASQLDGLSELAKAKNIDISQLTDFLMNWEQMSIDEPRAIEEFKKQLGKRWNGIDALPMLEKALCVSLIACSGGKKLREKGMEFLNQISRTYVSVERSPSGQATADFSGLEQLKLKVEQLPVWQTIQNSHAYESTILMRLTDRRKKIGARSGGKVPPKRYHWLKEYNEQLWRNMHKVGAQRPWAEGMGAFIHYENEIRCGFKLPHPAVEGGITSLEKSMHTSQWIFNNRISEEETAEAMELLKLLQKSNDEYGDTDKHNGQQKPRQN